MSTSPTLILDSVSVSVGGTQILSDITLHLYKSHHYLLTGPNGSGKSTLLRALWDPTLVTHGTISYPGFDMQTPIRDQFGYVSEEFVNHVYETAMKNAEYTSYSGHSHDMTTYIQLTQDVSYDEDYFQYLIDTWSLRDLMSQPTHTLSTGQLQICLLVRALSKKPRVLILDEAYEGLDRTRREHLHRHIRQISNDTQIICVAHHQTDVPTYITDYITIQNRACIHSPRQSLQPTQTPVSGSKNQVRPSFGTPCVAHLQQVHVKYRDHVVFSDFSWKVHAGEKWLVSGPNGSGKSTLVALLTAAHPQAHDQQIQIGPYTFTESPCIWDIKQHISYMTPALTHRFHRPISVYEVVASGLYDTIGLYTSPSTSAHLQVMNVMRQCQIDHMATRPFRSLSKGQKQLVLLARAFVKKALLLILDEPTRGLDASHRQHVINLIDTIGQTDQTMIYVTHREDEIPRCITHNLFLKKS